VEWRESTRTPQPVELLEAETLFALAVVDRMAQGFVDPATALVSQAEVIAAPPAVRRALDDGLLARLTGEAWERLSQSGRNRLVWRIGEHRVADAVPILIELLERGDAMQDYCVAWAVGRCGDPGAAVAMRELHVRGRSDAVKRIALHAWLQLAPALAIKKHADALIATWPPALRAAWSAQDPAQFEQLHAHHDVWRALSLSTWLE